MCCHLPSKVALDTVVQFKPDVTMTVYNSGDSGEFEHVACFCSWLLCWCQLAVLRNHEYMFPESADTAQERPSSPSKGWCAQPFKRLSRRKAAAPSRPGREEAKCFCCRG